MFSKEFLQSPAGQASLDYAEQVYASLFQGGDFTLAQFPDMFEELVAYHMQPTYAPMPLNSHQAQLLMDDEEDAFECFYEPEIIAEGLSRSDSESLVKVSTYSWLCNYKGEAEGEEFALKEKVAHLPVYHSKWNYSNFG